MRLILVVDVKIKREFNTKLRKALLEDLSGLIDSFIYQIKDYKNIQKRVFGDYDFHKLTMSLKVINA